MSKKIISEKLKKNDAKIVSMHANGVSWTRIAEELGLCRESIVKYMIKNHGYVREKKTIVHNMPITPSVLEEAKTMYQTGQHTVTSIAEKFNVPRKKLSKMLKAEGVIVRKDGKKPVNSDFFEVIDTPQKAYWLGFFYADGYNSGEGIEFSLKEEDLESVKAFRSALGGTQKISHKKVVFDGQVYWSWRISIHDKKLSTDLARAGAPRAKSFIIRLPELDDSLMPHFIRGFFDGDGSFYCPQGRGLMTAFTSGDSKFLEDLQEYLGKVLPEIKWHIYFTKVWELRTAVRGTKLFGNYIYQNSSPETRLERKYQLYVNNCRPEPKVA